LNKSEAFEAIRGLSFEEKCIRNPVPKKMHWVWFGVELPEKYVSNIEDMAVANPLWEIFFWSELPSQPLKETLKNHGVRYTFKNITKYLEDGLLVNGDLILKEKNLAGKSDYFRMEAIYLEGGIYLDTDTYPVQPFDNFGDLFRWPFASYEAPTYNNLSNGIFGFEKGSRFLKFALQLTRENCLKYQICGVMSGAGPDFLSAALFFYDDPDIILIASKYTLTGKDLPSAVTYSTMDATWL